MIKVLILLHGFLGKKKFLEEIKSEFENQNKIVFDKIENWSFYSSEHGLDLSKQNHVGSPIYDPKTNDLVSNIYGKLIALDNSFGSKTQLDITIIAHSMGGLVARALTMYKTKLLDEKAWISDKSFISILILLGTPNHGTKLANNWLTIPIEILVDSLANFFLINNNKLTKDHIKNNSQMAQMGEKSLFLKDLNKHEEIQGVKIITVAGEDNTFGVLPNLWEPFVFWKIWFSTNFPWIHIGQIKNDGIVEAKSIPLKGKNNKNYTLKSVNHMTMLSWKTNSAGRQVKKIIFNYLINENKN